MKKQLKLNLIQSVLLLFGVLGIVCIIIVCKIKIYTSDYQQLSQVTENDFEKENEIKIEREEKRQKEEVKNQEKRKEEEVFATKSEYEIKENDIIDFTYSFLKIENQMQNKVYSPMLIKNSLLALERISNGNTQNQISKLVGDKIWGKFNTNEKMKIDNKIVLKDILEKSANNECIKEIDEYNRINVEFENKSNFEDYIYTHEHHDFFNDEDSITDIILYNSIALERLEWKNDFFQNRNDGNAVVKFLHEKKKVEVEDSYYDDEALKEESIDIYDTLTDSVIKFYNESKLDGNADVKEMSRDIFAIELNATINNYDIVNEIGENKIRQIVEKQYRMIANKEYYDRDHIRGDKLFSEEFWDKEVVDKDINEYLPKYISELDSNYHKVGSSTDFSLYTDEDVKVFAKDFKEYNNTKLQFVAIMPVNEDLSDFIKDLNSDRINMYTSKLKELVPENFAEGVVTKIHGYIPDFEIEYNLSLEEDLKKLGVTDIFKASSADVSNLIQDNNICLNAIHDAKINIYSDTIELDKEENQNNIDDYEIDFDYKFDVPIEEIDLTFDRPFLFLVRDKETNEIWLTGTIYSPL